MQRWPANANWWYAVHRTSFYSNENYLFAEKSEIAKQCHRTIDLVLQLNGMQIGHDTPYKVHPAGSCESANQDVIEIDLLNFQYRSTPFDSILLYMQITHPTGTMRKGEMIITFGESVVGQHLAVYVAVTTPCTCSVYMPIWFRILERNEANESTPNRIH